MTRALELLGAFLAGFGVALWLVDWLLGGGPVVEVDPFREPWFE